MERFWEKVDCSSTEPDACWPWIAATNADGYGKFGKDRTWVLAHVFLFEHLNGPLLPGFHVLHRCDEPPCVRPVHLFAGTQQDNMADMKRKGRSTYGERNHTARLTEDDVRTILALKGQILAKDIAERFGVAKSTVAHIHTRRSWKHVPFL